MTQLTHIDTYLSDNELLDAFDDAYNAFIEWSSLLRTTIAYYCTSGKCDDVKESCDIQESKNDREVYWHDHDMILPDTISKGHVVHLDFFGIFPRNLYDMCFSTEVSNVTVSPANGIILPPLYLFEGNDEYTSEDIVFLQFENQEDRVVPVTKVVSDDDIDDVTLLSDVIIKPLRYLYFLDELLNVVKFRFSVFQPLFVAHGYDGILFPRVDSDCIFLPDNGVILVEWEADGRDDLPLYKQLSFKIENYVQTTCEKFDRIHEELMRRQAVRTANRTSVEQERDFDRNREIRKWSKSMTKKSACELLGGWSIGKLNDHIATNHGIARKQRNRQDWRFDCNDPSFASLPVDENYNKNL